MPADKPNLNLCKVIMSSLALGYPAPTLLNWEGDFNRPEWHFAGSHIAKLESLLAVLEELLEHADDAHEDDLALMIDAYDIWFQLPPGVLISRFDQLNREADERNRRTWEELGANNPSGFPIPPPKQSIIVTTAKDCFPDYTSGSDPHYDHWPPSPMPEDLYGEGTDQLAAPIMDPARKYRKMRPRCVNSGMIMGTMGTMRAALRRCKEKADEVARRGRQLWSDQALFGEVMGEQELWREWVRELASTWNGTASESPRTSATRDVRPVALAATLGQHFEFGIGLDYNFTTIPPTCSAEEDGYFIKIADSEDVKRQSEEAGVPDGVRLRGIPPELEEGRLEVDDGSKLKDVKWDEMALYSDFYFGNTPVGIHHNAYVENLKPWRLANWWELMWFYPRLRELVTQSIKIAAKRARPLVKLTHREDDIDITYRNPKGSHRVMVFTPERGAEPASFNPIGWDGVCQKGPTPWYEELFDDDEGPLKVLV
jgi:hypothetical protein